MIQRTYLTGDISALTSIDTIFVIVNIEWILIHTYILLIILSTRSLLILIKVFSYSLLYLYSIHILYVHSSPLHVLHSSPTYPASYAVYAHPLIHPHMTHIHYPPYHTHLCTQLGTCTYAPAETRNQLSCDIMEHINII